MLYQIIVERAALYRYYTLCRIALIADILYYRRILIRTFIKSQLYFIADIVFLACIVYYADKIPAIAFYQLSDHCFV